MRKWWLFIWVAFILTGCRSTPFDIHTVIDWVDFIKWDGKEYNGIHSAVLTNESYVGEKIGEVRFRVADNVTNPNYKTKNGDAAFHEKGTEILAIKEHPYLIAIASDESINGYRLYYSNDDLEYQWHFKDMPLNQVQTIQIYQENALLSEWSSESDVKRFLGLLENSEPNSAFQPNTDKGDPAYYDMIFYTNGPISYRFNLQYDGTTYFWYPWDTNILSEEIGSFLQ